MPRIIINDVEYNGEIGERLIDVARRNGAHIGFVCDGAGFCQTCVCRVTHGAENLSEPNDKERTWHSDEWLDAGMRLACQTTIRGGGTVELTSRAEELRRQVVAIFAPPHEEATEEEDTTMGRAGLLLDSVVRIVGNQLVRFPGNAVRAVGMMVNIRPTPRTVGKVFTDATHVVRTMGLFGSPEEKNQTR